MEAKRVKLTNMQARILAVLPIGRKNAKPVTHLAEKAAIDKKRIRTVRIDVSDLIFDHDVPIGSSSDQDTLGIFLIENDADLHLACHTLDSRVMQTIKRKQKIIENYYKRQQQKLDLDKQE